MKKILLATTAIVAFAGAASAEVRLSGFAEMGVSGGNGAGRDGEEQFHNDISITFNASGETDGGLKFGVKAQIDNNNGREPNGPVVWDDESVFISGAFGKLTLGETDGALDWALSEIYAGSSINDDHSTHSGGYFNSGLDAIYDNQIARYEYSFGDFAFGASVELDDNPDFAGVDDPLTTVVETTGAYVQGDVNWAIGGKWSGDVAGTNVGFGAAYQSNNVYDIFGFTASAQLAGGFTANGEYIDLDGKSGHDSWIGVAAGYAAGPLLVQVNYGVFNEVVGSDVEGYGAVVNYDLGGGVVAMAGYGHGDTDAGNGAGDSTWSVGLGLSF